MDTALAVLTHVLVGIALMWTVANVARGVQRRERIRALAEAGPTRRIRAYRRMVVRSWALIALVSLIVLASADLSGADLGWTWPRIDGGNQFNVLAWTMIATWLTGSVVGGLLWRHRRRRSAVMPPRPDSPLVPRAPAERRLAAAVAVSVGTCEEMVYRGLIIGVGTYLYELHLLVVVVVSLAIFVIDHAYQGRRGMIGAGLVGAILTIAYVGTGSLVLPVALHVGHNLVSLFLFPAGAPRPATPPGPETSAVSTAPTVRSMTPDRLDNPA
ncbi:MAG: CPBP family intramembrane metalloprotease [Micromonosporaceae bacterium]|nr:CPBP family intramembrane metalloprotease [Micromonosporaceae bacterium]